MKVFRQLGLTAMLAGLFLFSSNHPAAAQVSVQVGPAPVCPYGYYEVPPYQCAPDGFYGPEWFDGGVFIGAGPWYHGRDGFYGRVDHHFDFREGYRGPYPERGAQRGEHRNEFRGEARHDPHGHEAPRDRR